MAHPTSPCPVPLPLLLSAKREFIEMPGLRLTAAQACRLWTLEPPLGAALLDRLVADGFLLRTGDAFRRCDEPTARRPTAA
jgi:hypothetical protein